MILLSLTTPILCFDYLDHIVLWWVLIWYLRKFNLWSNAFIWWTLARMVNESFRLEKSDLLKLSRFGSGMSKSLGIPSCLASSAAFSIPSESTCNWMATFRGWPGIESDIGEQFGWFWVFDFGLESGRSGCPDVEAVELLSDEHGSVAAANRLNVDTD